VGPADKGRVKGVVLAVVLVLGGLGVLLTINQTFNLQLFGLLILDTSFYYILLTLFLSLTFLLYPGRVGDAEKVPWYDWLLFLATVCTTAWLAWNGGRIVAEGWDIAAPTDATILAGIVCVLALEA